MRPADEGALQGLGVMLGWVLLLLLPLLGFVPWILAGYGVYRLGRGMTRSGKCRKCGAPLRQGMCATCGATRF